MASPLTHIAVGYSIFRAVQPHFPQCTDTWKRGILLCGIVGAALIADADALPGLWGQYLGDTHNQYSHSLVTAGLIGAGVALLGSLMTRVSPARWWVGGLLGALAHVGIDFMTLGRGLMLFWPLTDARFSSPLPLFYGLRWSEGVWSTAHLVTLANELPIIIGLLWLQLKSTNLVDHVRER